MAGTQDEYITPEMEPEMTPEMMEELEEMQSDQAEDSAEDQQLMNEEMLNAYGAPEMKELQNQHTFLHKATFGSEDTVRTTFLHEHELGRPTFTVRFLLDMIGVSHYYLDPIIKELDGEPNIHNGIAIYFKDKTQNITASGMSNKGFSMNLNVTRKMDATRKRFKENTSDNMKGGESR